MIIYLPMKNKIRTKFKIRRGEVTVYKQNRNAICFIHAWHKVQRNKVLDQILCDKLKSMNSNSKPIIKLIEELENEKDADNIQERSQQQRQIA